MWPTVHVHVHVRTCRYMYMYVVCHRFKSSLRQLVFGFKFHLRQFIFSPEKKAVLRYSVALSLWLMCSCTNPSE